MLRRLASHMQLCEETRGGGEGGTAFLASLAEPQPFTPLFLRPLTTKLSLVF